MFFLTCHISSEIAALWYVVSDTGHVEKLQCLERAEGSVHCRQNRGHKSPDIAVTSQQGSDPTEECCLLQASEVAHRPGSSGVSPGSVGAHCDEGRAARSDALQWPWLCRAKGQLFNLGITWIPYGARKRRSSKTLGCS